MEGNNQHETPLGAEVGRKGVGWWPVVRDAAIIGIIAAGVGIAVNLLRSDGIPLIATVPYDIVVPCPEPLGEVFAVPVEELHQEGTLLVDARYPEDFAAWHLEGARNIPWDELDPVPKETVAELIRLGARRIVVYGDARDPDSGYALARELAGRGARNVGYVPGGAPALNPGGGQP